MKRIFIVLCTGLILIWAPQAVCQDPQRSPSVDMKAMKYKPGQVWSYDARPGEEKSYFIVLKIESDSELGTIVHLALRGLKMKNPRSPDGLSENVNHMPFSLEAINRSAIKLLQEKADLPPFEEGYKLWREAFDAKRAGIYTISVAEAVNVMEVGLNQ